MLVAMPTKEPAKMAALVEEAHSLSMLPSILFITVLLKRPTKEEASTGLVTDYMQSRVSAPQASIMKGNASQLP